jgi:hypothetical protein
MSRSEGKRFFYRKESPWRLPTLDELLTLLEPDRSNRRALTDPAFSDAQAVIWTGDEAYPGRAWAANFMKSTATLWEILKIRVSWVRPVAGGRPFPHRSSGEMWSAISAHQRS